MKKLTLSIIFAAVNVTICFAQTPVQKTAADTTQAFKRGTVNICTMSRGKLIGNPPLYIIYSGNNKIIYRSDTAKAKIGPLSVIKQEAIASMNILNDSTAIQRFGKAAAWGVIEIHLIPSASIDELKNAKPAEQGKQQ